METIYPEDDEIKFRKKNYNVIEEILKDKVECTICNNDLLNEIISKKMIMVHSSHLFLCCYSCFYKLCEGNEFSCILCKSNIELSNCEKCNHNVCDRCIVNHKINRVSNGILHECFGCKPQMLWRQRAQAANILKIFSSQLDMPNGLLVNEIERDQIVRKFLVKESKLGQNSKTDAIKNHMCLNFILNSYKSYIIKILTEFSPNIEDNTPVNEYLRDFIKICENVLEKTCTTLTNSKRIFNLNSHLNPGVSAIMKSLLKPIDEDEHVSNNLRLNGNLGKIEKTEIANDFLNSKYITKKSKNKQKVDNDISEPLTTINNNNNVQLTTEGLNKKLVVVLERLDDSILSQMKNYKPSIKKDDHEIDHALDLFGNSPSSDEEINTRKLRSRKIVKTKKEDKIIQASKNLSKNNKIRDAKSDDEKENDRLIKLNNIGKRFKQHIVTDEDDNDTNSVKTVKEDKNSKVLKKNAKEDLDKIKMITQAINNIDEINSDTDDNSYSEENVPTSIKYTIGEVRDSVVIPQIETQTNSEESDDSSIFDVINSCLAVCNRRGIDHYRKKSQENQFDFNEMKTIQGSDEIENEENNVMSESSSKNDDASTVTSKQQPRFRMPSISSDSDSDVKISSKKKLLKRKFITSNSSSNSDSSSKYFKKTPKKIKKSDIGHSLSSTSDNSNSSSVENKSPVNSKNRRRIKKLTTDEDVSSSSDASITRDSPKKGRKNIRKMKKKTDLSQLTLDALHEEESRKKRIEERQKLYNQIYSLPTPMATCKKLVLDFDPKTKEELVTVHPDLVKFLKPHQVEGVKFLWNSVFESLAQIKKGKGSGSIIAHCMGLGKTLQVITLVHTLFRHPNTDVKTVLIITPHATIENWCKEFHKWLNDINEEKNFTVFNLTESKTYRSRKTVIEQWRREHGVLITSYQMYRTIVTFKTIDKYPSILEGLVNPGPDLVICDEGHLLKNQATAISKVVNRIKTLRRIVLTGTPLQNSLKEYHCMVDFIRPNLLGSIKEFTNRFINPITNGQYSDSTPLDVKLMKRRSHVLHRMLEGFVQRFDYSVLTPFLPPKHEYVIYLKLSDKQIELYRHYLDNYRQPELFTNYNMLQMIWTHPKLLSSYAKRVERKKEKQKFKDLATSFVNDSTSCSDSNSNSTEEIDENEQILVSNLESSKIKEPEMDLYWWKPLVTKKDLEYVYPYSKFLMMFSILQECEDIGDKVLIFSQSLNTLDAIQDFLENAEDMAHDAGGPYGKSWIQGEDFFRIDGSVSLKIREDNCSKFNDVTNPQMRLLLLSTKAFNLGINLVGANRVIIFDVTWNPALNVQSIFRVFRFGQTKPCYIYRLVSEGTMEQKIYERQISKLSMAFRVIDEHQIDRHFNAKDQEELYEFDPNTTTPKATLNLPKDRLMAELILKHKDLVMDILEHDSLLQNNEAEELNEFDRNAAWDDYQKEKEEVNRMQLGIHINNQNTPIMNNPNSNMQVPPFQTTPEDLTLFNHLRTLFPQATMLQLNDMLIQVKQRQNFER